MVSQNPCSWMDAMEVLMEWTKWKQAHLATRQWSVNYYGPDPTTILPQTYQVASEEGENWCI